MTEPRLRAEFAKRAKAAKIRAVIARLERQGVNVDEIVAELEKMRSQILAKPP